MVVHFQSLADRPVVVRRPEQELSPPRRRHSDPAANGPQAVLPLSPPVGGFAPLAAGGSLIAAQELRQSPSTLELRIQFQGANLSPVEVTDADHAQAGPGPGASTAANRLDPVEFKLGIGAYDQAVEVVNNLAQADSYFLSPVATSA